MRPSLRLLEIDTPPELVSRYDMRGELPVIAGKVGALEIFIQSEVKGCHGFLILHIPHQVNVCVVRGVLRTHLFRQNIHFKPRKNDARSYIQRIPDHTRRIVWSDTMGSCRGQ